MRGGGADVSRRVVKQLLKKHGYVKRKSQKQIAGGSGENRNEQFENISEKIADFADCGDPYISMDTKKKELIGKYSRGNDGLYGSCAERTNDHDFKGKDTEVGVPHGIYDQKYKQGHIMIGKSHDTSEFACDSIANWWNKMGAFSYPSARRLLILCDGGGSNSSRHYIFKEDLQNLATELGIDITIAHFPPYCSKWNPIEHRLFPHVSNALRRGATIDSIEHMAQKIRRTKTKTGVSVSVFTTEKEYSTGRKYAQGFKENNQIQFDPYLPRWNYTAKAAP
jgi:glycosyltransferase involved in cell wall biosynthesis